ncbi:hypothetical protein DMN57_00055 [Escherichia coli]|nr:hypothetical protein [Escherichia coli]
MPNPIAGCKTPGSIAARRCRTNCQRTTCFQFPAVSCAREYRSRARVTRASACRSRSLVVVLFGASDGLLDGVIAACQGNAVAFQLSAKLPHFLNFPCARFIQAFAGCLTAASALLFFAEHCTRAL